MKTGQNHKHSPRCLWQTFHRLLHKAPWSPPSFPLACLYAGAKHSLSAGSHRFLTFKQTWTARLFWSYPDERKAVQSLVVGLLLLPLACPSHPDSCKNTCHPKQIYVVHNSNVWPSIIAGQTVLPSRLTSGANNTVTLANFSATANKLRYDRHLITAQQTLPGTSTRILHNSKFAKVTGLHPVTDRNQRTMVSSCELAK